MNSAENIIEKMFRLSDLYWWSFLPQEDGTYNIDDDKYEQYAALYQEVEQLFNKESIPSFIKKDIKFVLAYCKAIKLRLFSASVKTALGKVITAEEFSYQQYPFIAHFKTLLNWIRTKNKNEFPEYSLILLNSHLPYPTGVMAPEYFHRTNKYIYGALDEFGGYILVVGTKDRCVFRLSNQFINTNFDIKVSHNEIKEYEVVIKDGEFALEDTDYFVDSIMDM